MTQRFESELELSYTMSKQEYIKLLSLTQPNSQMPILLAYNAETITQKWLSVESLAGGTCRHRIRKVEYTDKFRHSGLFSPLTRGSHYEYTTKYYWNTNNKSRIEINSSLTPEEYEQIANQYDVPFETKTRIYLEDVTTGDHYTADIKSDGTVVLEIEFSSPEVMQAYTDNPPEWVKNLIKNNY